MQFLLFGVLMVLTLEGGSEAGKVPGIELVSKAQLLGLLGCFGLKSCESEHPEMFRNKVCSGR